MQFVLWKHLTRYNQYVRSFSLEYLESEKRKFPLQVSKEKRAKKDPMAHFPPSLSAQDRLSGARVVCLSVQVRAPSAIRQTAFFASALAIRAGTQFLEGKTRIRVDRVASRRKIVAAFLPN